MAATKYHEFFCFGCIEEVTKHQSQILHKSLFILAIADSRCWTGKVSDSLLLSTYILAGVDPEGIERIC